MFHDASAYTVVSTERPRSMDHVRKKPRVDRGELTVRECSHCLRRGHTIDECFKLKTCAFCNAKGHIKAHCYKFKAFNAKGKRPLHKSSFSPQHSANNVGVLSPPYVDDTPFDTYDVPQPSAPADIQQLLSSSVVQDIVQTVMTQVMQAFSGQKPPTSTEHQAHYSLNSSALLRGNP